VISSLRGTLLDKGSESVVIEAGGVGYSVTPTAAAMRALPAVGAEVRLFIYTHFVQDSPWQLYGFADGDERRVFETLISVQGVGPRVGVALLAGLPLPELVKAITSSDLGRLTQIRGVGRKIAERLALELRDKIAALGVASPRDGAPPPSSATAVPSGRLGEVHGALVSLGYRPVEFAGVLDALDAEQPTPDLIKQALAALRRK